MNLEREPSQIIGYITAVATAIIALLVAYGFDIDQTKQAAILGVIAVLAPAIAGIVIRFNVWAPQSVQSEVDAAAASGTAPKIV